MSAVIADAGAAGAAAPVAPGKKGKKKLIVIVAAALVLALGLGGGTVVYLKKKAHAAAEAEAEEGGGEAAHAAAKPDLHTPPTYLPLDPFIVNLADKQADRYAQIGIVLEVESTTFADQLRGYMPAVRNAILMVITKKTSRDLLDGDGKEMLAQEIMLEAVRPMGIEVAMPMAVTHTEGKGEPADAKTQHGGDDEAAKPKPEMAKAKTKGAAVKNPIRNVNFSSFIIQ